MGQNIKLKNTQYWGKTPTKSEFLFSLDLNPNISSFSWCPKQFATSFKMFLDNWNIQTSLWLKRWIILTEHVCAFWNLWNNVSFVAVLCRVCYERCPYNPTAATFLLSAIWHGVYPGYYLTFITGIVVTMAARAVSILYIRWAAKTRYHKAPEGVLSSIAHLLGAVLMEKYCYIRKNWTLVSLIINQRHAGIEKRLRSVKVIINLVVCCILLHGND